MSKGVGLVVISPSWEGGLCVSLQGDALLRVWVIFVRMCIPPMVLRLWLDGP
jgi:hypothetical protein